MNNTSYPWSLLRRFVIGLIGVLGLILLVTASKLEPDPRGFGTHQQLGLASCYFQELIGMRCPMCGGTTAWALVTRGEIVRAAHTNLASTLLFVVVAIGSPIAIATALNGKKPSNKKLSNWLTLRSLLVMASIWSAVAVLDWLRKLI